LVLNNVGHCLEELNKRDRALVCYRQALGLEPMNRTLVFNLGACLINMGELDESLEFLSSHTQEDPEDRKAYGLMGEIYDRLQKFDLAIDCYNKCLGLE
jgi:tetratricopeptide (TPR) repeat protein